MGSDVGQMFPTASLHRDHSILYALVCEKELSHMGKKHGNPDLVCENIRIYHECEDDIKKSVLRITDWHHEANRSITNSDRKGRIYLSNSHKNNFFSCSPLNTAFLYFSFLSFPGVVTGYVR